MEQVSATMPAPGGVNDDSYLVGPRFAAVLDGCTDPGRDSGCEHDVPWLVSRLSAHLASGLAAARPSGLPDVVAQAIKATMADHPGCDLTNPDSPSSTVTVLREIDDEVEYLVLGDSPLVFEHADGGVRHLVDDQVDHLPGYSFDEVAHWRNRDGGFWVAAAVPEAAYRGVHGVLQRDDVRRALLVTDGVSRLVDRYGWSWNRLMETAVAEGPRRLIAAVHAEDALAGDPDGPWPQPVRGKRFDDATAVLCQIADSSGR